MKPCRCRLMKKIQTLSFAVHETVLYLDGHPDDRLAVSYYNTQNAKLSQAISEYEDTFGPLTQNGFEGNGDWTWINGPWPWKYEANVCDG